MKLLFSILLCGITILGYGQIQKGDFLIRGGGASVTDVDQGASFSKNDFKLDVGYFVNQQWMAGAGVDLSLTEFSSFVGNKIFTRFYFKDSLQNKRLLYLEGRFETIQYSPIGVGQSNRRFKYKSGVIAGGIDFFLSQHLAIEAQMDYIF